ncbi:MAG: DUF4288 domain-containing protein [Flammeovirgaceae bacterium]|nr:DUF4288 domain-containing protein [Flammeovirgaceae bacterium]
MNWYISKIVFGISVENKNARQFDEQLRLINAENEEEALLKARMIGLAEEDSFMNDDNKRIKWEFINVAELIPLKKLEDGIELYSRIHETDEAKLYVNFIHQKAISLRLNSGSLF